MIFLIFANYTDAFLLTNGHFWARDNITANLYVKWKLTCNKIDLHTYEKDIVIIFGVEFTVISNASNQNDSAVLVDIRFLCSACSFIASDFNIQTNYFQFPLHHTLITRKMFEFNFFSYIMWCKTAIVFAFKNKDETYFKKTNQYSNTSTTAIWQLAVF